MPLSRLFPIIAGVVAIAVAGLAPAAPTECAGAGSGKPTEHFANLPGEPVVFESFGLEDFQGAGSIASALRASDVHPPDVPTPVRVMVKGPSAPEQAANPLQAELKGRVDGIDLSAGLLADRTVIEAGPTKLVGGMAMAHDHARGRESLELRTSIGQTTNAAKIALELGPRIERRLPGGMTLFVDGKAEAQSAPPQATTWQPLAGPAFDGVGIIGLTGRTGLMR